MPNPLLLTMAVLELGTGVALLLAPSLVVGLLLGEGLASTQSLVLGRITGAALVSIAIACWRASLNEPISGRGLVGGMLFYNLAVPILLAHAAIVDGMHGAALWPGCAIHVALAIWCMICLLRNRIKSAI